LTVNCTQPDTETVARVGNGSGNDGATIRFPADLYRNFRCDPGILAQPKRPKAIMDLIAAQEIEIRRLLQSELQSYVHAVIQCTVAGFIIHIGKNKGVGGRKRNRTLETPVKRSSGN